MTNNLIIAGCSRRKFFACFEWCYCKWTSWNCSWSCKGSNWDRL